MWSEDAQKQFQNSSDEPSDSEDESSDDGGGPSGGKSREERKKEKKARKEAAIAKKRGQGVEVGDMPSSGEDSEEDSDDDMPVNPNHTKAARNMAMSTPDKEVEEAAEGVKKLAVAANRKERESSEAAAAKARYQQLHEAGKTDEAKADLARLKVIREQRAAEAARRAVRFAFRATIPMTQAGDTDILNRPKRRRGRLKRRPEKSS